MERGRRREGETEVEDMEVEEGANREEVYWCRGMGVNMIEVHVHIYTCMESWNETQHYV